ncbi:conserved Plasmodium protein, unknown function [Plasmodium gallinaceum]|uniref:RNase III domain-containing protein n=1 Tax=Plasmodium gallinaceum TaxID=5849 RepID=A0A1J1GX71_PLAGA|nr:conserved Plasmodium protein, unknown function [Plasmodium gallinaceum]CRG97071.1 conserved Plasmodium protein, unknown function [Plasmodium gallinaceum]
MKENYNFFLYVPFIFFFLLWNSTYVCGQIKDKVKVKQIAKFFENYNNSPNSRVYLDENNSIGEHSQNRDHLLNRRDIIKDENIESLSNDIDKDSLSFYEGVNDTGYDENSYQRNKRNILQEYTDDDSDIYDEAYANDKNKPNVKNPRLYLGKSFEDFHNALGLTIDDFNSGTDSYYEKDNIFSKSSISNESIYDNIQLDKSNVYENFNTESEKVKTGYPHLSVEKEPFDAYKSRNSYNTPLYGDKNKDHGNYSKYTEHIYDDPESYLRHKNESIYNKPVSYSRRNNESIYDEPLSYSGHNNENTYDEVFRTPHTSNNNIYDEAILHLSRRNSSADKSPVLVRSKYDTPVENDDSINHDNILSSENNVGHNSREERPPTIPPFDFNAEKNFHKRYDYNDQLGNTNNYFMENSDTIQNKKGFLGFFKKNKSKNNSTKDTQRYEDTSRIINEKLNERYGNSENLTELEMFNKYQDKYFLNRIVNVSNSRIKKMLGKDSPSTVPVTHELESVTGKCLVKNIPMLSNDIMLKNLCFNNLRTLKYYQQIISSMDFNCKSKNKSCIDIGPMVYNESKTVNSIINILPNIYTLNMTEFILTNPKLCKQFKLELKKKKEKNYLNVTDIVLLLSNSYFKRVNPRLVNHMLTFLKTQNHTHLIKYYLGVLISFSPFIKPAIKIYFHENYHNLTPHFLDFKIKSIIYDLIGIAHRWTAVFNKESTQQTTNINTNMLKTLKKFYNNTNVRFYKKFKSLESILSHEKILNDHQEKNYERLKAINENIMKYMNNIYSLFFTNKER